MRFAALDAARARGREILTDDPDLGDAAVAPEALDRLAAAQDGARLRECLGRLDAKHRAGIMLAFVHGLSHAQLAEKLNEPLGTLVGIAVRPADGKLYGLTDTGQMVTIDTAIGQATQVSRLSEKTDTGARTAIRFNPVVDRLRVVGVNGNNYRIQVDTGAVTTDKPLRYAEGSAQAGQQPMVTAAAYTNAMAGAKETALYTLDPRLGQVNLPAPPNDGVLQPKANAGMALPYGVGFDFLSDGNGGNWGFVVAAGKLHSYSATDAKFSTIGPITGLTWDDLLGIAATK